ncbi:hypothetical protein Cni_G24778 [Canna indica]|uniref:DOG1 domain-containing protein n=1 Tax=Canna indica TaxID=4628 RepID=A0AAQ3QKF6_9LILI|nr:hypothetical protein Cni_G24778 [Canna indica]
MESFFDSWVARLDELRSDLLAALSRRPDSVPPAIDALLDHYREYCDAKAHLADTDVLRLLSHSWLTPFERTFLWVAGWKPSLVFRLVPQCNGGGGCPLSPDQRAAVEELEREVVAAEHRISERMARAQEVMAGQAVLEAVRDGARNRVMRAAAADEVAQALLAVVAAADELRDATLRRMVEILAPAQTAEFLAAAAELRLRVRRWGLRRNAQQPA